MSFLPQQKKSAAEIAKLRESLGIPHSEEFVPEEAVPHLEAGHPNFAAPAPAPQAATTTPLVDEAPAPVGLAPMPQVHPHEPKPVRSLRRSERIPVLPVVLNEPDAAPAPQQQETILPASSPLPVASGLKPVRSLRKSEQMPSQHVEHAPRPDSILPQHRHNANELNDLRRRQALAQLEPHAAPPKLTAHWSLIGVGYILAAAAAACAFYYELRIEIPAGALLSAWLIALFVFLARPLSRHHAAFIMVISLLVTVFGALQYFPQLRYGNPSQPPAEMPGTPTIH